MNLDFDPEPPYHVRSHFSMSAADIEYGWKIIDALKDLGNARTLRLLGRERGVSFADVIDAWIAWRNGEAAMPATPELITAFADDFCGRRAIPPALYRGFASLEFSA